MNGLMVTFVYILYHHQTIEMNKRTTYVWAELSNLMLYNDDNGEKKREKWKQHRVVKAYENPVKVVNALDHCRCTNISFTSLLLLSLMILISTVWKAAHGFLFSYTFTFISPSTKTHSWKCVFVVLSWKMVEH